MRHFLMVVALAAAVSPALSAQRLDTPAKRPHLETTADTNDAAAYFAHGVERFSRDPEESAAAFYWAARINPGWGDPLYARRAATLMADRHALKLYMEGNRRMLESDDMRRLDSLQFRALMLSPFLYRKLDRPMFMQYFTTEITGNRGSASAELQYEIDAYLRRAGNGFRAWLAYSDGDFERALKLYAMSLPDSKDKASVHLDRARIFSMRSQVDSATAEFKSALDEMRKKDQKDLVVFYNSKALVEYSIGVLLEGAGDNAGAREAYGRALTEDLSYYPAHMRLGLVSLGLKDTTAAMSELALASQLAPDEPHIRYVNGFVLAVCKHYDEGIVELKKAIALEPYYALPYLRLGQISEQLGKAKEAADAYDGFLKRANASDPQRAFAEEHLTEIKEILAAQAITKP